jgi:DNA-directed RNA polymerase specialized sigma24 family protein
VAASLLDETGAPSEQDRAVLAHLAAGRSYRETAEVLGIDPGLAKALVTGVVGRVQAGAAAVTG